MGGRAPLSPGTVSEGEPRARIVGMSRLLSDRVKEYLSGAREKSRRNLLKLRAATLIVLGFGGPFIFYVTYNVLLVPGVFALSQDFARASCTVAQVRNLFVNSE